MLLTAAQVIVIELAILIIYFCFKQTRRVNVTKVNKERVQLSDHKNQEARLSKRKKNENPKAKIQTQGRRRRKPEGYHFEYNEFLMDLRTKPKIYPIEKYTESEDCKYSGNITHKFKFKTEEIKCEMPVYDDEYPELLFKLINEYYKYDRYLGRDLFCEAKTP